MTLLITMIRPEGVWQSADHRVTMNGQVVDDTAPKQIHIMCPPLPGGPHVLLAFTGLAVLADGTPTLQWVRETLRGETRTIMDTLSYLRDRLTRDVGQSRLWNVPLVFSGGVFEGDKRFYVEIRNVDPKTRLTKRDFDYVVGDVTDPTVFIGGSGAISVEADDIQLLQDQARIKPAKWENHLGLLAAVNRRAARHTQLVSPWCYATYLSAGSEGAQAKSFSKPGEPMKAPGIETLLGGIDAFELTKDMAETMRRLKEGKDPLPTKADDHGERAVKGRP